ncbi:ABC-three component system protein [Thomasclavelia sp.]
MNTEIYMTYIEERLFVLQLRVISRASLNILGLNTRAEDLYKGLFNIIFDYNLTNLNSEESNAEAIDLKDDNANIIIQVSSTASRKKIEDTLKKDIMISYPEYNQKFIFIGKDATNLVNKTFENPHNVVFSPKEDIYDVKRLVKVINELDIDKMKEVYDYVEKYLELPKVSNNRVNSIIPKIIIALSETDLEDEAVSLNNSKAFEIEEKIHYNNLKLVQTIIEEFAPFSVAVSKIYDEFNNIGKNTSLSILNKIRKKYLLLSTNILDSDDLFFSIVKQIKNEMERNQTIMDSDINEEELEMCIQIIVVDAFIKCKIFKKPEV